MGMLLSKISSYPMAVIGSVAGSVTFDDIKPIILLIVGFLCDLLINFLKKKYNDKN